MSGYKDVDFRGGSPPNAPSLGARMVGHKRIALHLHPVYNPSGVISSEIPGGEPPDEPLTGGGIGRVDPRMRMPNSLPKPGPDRRHR